MEGLDEEEYGSIAWPSHARRDGRVASLLRHFRGYYVFSANKVLKKPIIFPVSLMGGSNGRPAAGTIVTVHDILYRTRN